MADISKITLPGSGGTYDIKDTVARSQASTNATNITNLTTTVNQIVNAGVSYEVVTALPSGTAIKKGVIYLIADSDAEAGTYAEYIGIEVGGSLTLEKIGTTATDLSDYLKSITYTPKTDVVLGEATTFTNGSSSVSFGSHTKATVLKSDVSATVPAYAGTQKHLTASASGTAVGANGTAAAITGFGTHTTANALGTGATFTTSVTPSTTNVKATASGTAVGADGTVTVNNYTGNKKYFHAGTTPSVVSLPTCTLPTVTDASWSFSMSGETLIISGNNGSHTTGSWSAGSVTAGTAPSVNTTSSGGTEILGSISAEAAGTALTGVKVTTQPTIALSTGATTGTGVVSLATGISSASTSVNNASAVAAITALGTPTTANALTGVKVTAQPTISLADTATSGGVTFVGSVSTSGTNSVTFETSGHTADAITALGAATAAAQTITVGTNDKVTALTSATTVVGNH